MILGFYYFGYFTPIIKIFRFYTSYVEFTEKRHDFFIIACKICGSKGSKFFLSLREVDVKKNLELVYFFTLRFLSQ